MTANWNAEQCRERHDHLEALLHQRIEGMQETLHRIERQTTLTNGRVTRLERWQVGFVAAITALGLAKWPELLSIIKVVGP